MLEAAPEGYRLCVGIALFNEKGRLFLAQRRGFLIECGWQMPQGGIDSGEDPLAAAERELTEETSIPIDQVALLGQIKRWLTYDFDTEAIRRDKLSGGLSTKFRGQTQRWFAFRLLGPDQLINLETDHPEFSAWMWADLQTAVDRIAPFKRAVYREVARAFAPYASA